MDTFRDAYIAEYGSMDVGLAGTGTPAGYDAIHFLAAAIELAGSDDPAAIGAALGEVTHEGICGTETTDGEHNLMHAMGVVGTSDGTLAGVELRQYYPAG
jgi:ABC-type branched-subunit amino acid transport system substrate-binding protein